jgi:hypothetical protein
MDMSRIVIVILIYGQTNLCISFSTCYLTECSVELQSVQLVLTCMCGITTFVLANVLWWGEAPEMWYNVNFVDCDTFS